jgi:hypothetical protein
MGKNGTEVMEGKKKSLTIGTCTYSLYCFYLISGLAILSLKHKTIKLASPVPFYR